MQRSAGFYALIQYSPVPERQEFLNLGLVLLVPDQKLCLVRMARGQARIKRLSAPPSPSYIEALKAGIANRLQVEFKRNGSVGDIEAFSAKRANEVRLSPFLPIAVSDPERVLNDLFVELVGDDEVKQRQPRIARRLRDAFANEGVYGLLDEDPEMVDLPEFGIQIRAPFGYQNGAYNLVDGLHLSSNQNEAMREAGKRAMEGQLLWKHQSPGGGKKRLVVVGDFKNHQNAFYNAVADQMDENNVRLYRLDNIKLLAEDIKDNARRHN